MSQQDLFGEPTPKPRRPRPKIKVKPDHVSLMRAAVPLIREHLWLSETPPPPPHPTDKPWSIQKDLWIWKNLAKSGFKPAEINGAIQHVRGVLPNQGGTPLRMTVFRVNGHGTPILEQAIGLYHKSQKESTFGLGASLPPKIRDILRGMVDG